jgi:glycosyltransferase involved in cell wall biosynthesis
VTDRADANPARIAVVPAYNEEVTVRGVLDRLYDFVDEVIVIDDGSADGTRRVIEEWLLGHDRATLLTFDLNQGMSAAYHLAFTALAARLAAGQLPRDTLICTVDADGQHDPYLLDHLVQIMVTENLDALLVQRDLADYPPYKKLGNTVLSKWASWWAGSRLLDVESGYRIFRASALADALQYYRGYQYSETVEVAVVLCRLGYRVRNDVVLSVPVFRSRTRLRDAVIDAAMIVVASWRARPRARKAIPQFREPALEPPLSQQ